MLTPDNGELSLLDRATFHVFSVQYSDGSISEYVQEELHGDKFINVSREISSLDDVLNFIEERMIAHHLSTPLESER